MKITDPSAVTPKLPTTGGMGVIVFGVLSLLFVAIGLATFDSHPPLRKRRS